MFSRIRSNLTTISKRIHPRSKQLFSHPQHSLARSPFPISQAQHAPSPSLAFAAPTITATPPPKAAYRSAFAAALLLCSSVVSRPHVVLEVGKRVFTDGLLGILRLVAAPTSLVRT